MNKITTYHPPYAPQVEDYTIVAGDYDVVIKEVKKHLKEGWSIYGQIVVRGTAGGAVFQTLVKYKK